VTSNQAIRRGTLKVYRISRSSPGRRSSRASCRVALIAAGCAFAGIVFALLGRPRDKEEDPAPLAESG
jgi:hypothetical protein